MSEVEGGKRIGLALSGGGIRAAVFHLGVLRHLAASGLLEDIVQISTVSGGSLIVGAVFAHSGMEWPSSRTYLAETYPALRSLLTSGDLLSLGALGASGIARENIAIVFRRSSILARQLAASWKVTGNLTDLPRSPEWHINTTCFETGKNWRFSRSVMGDWQFGRHFSPEIPIAKAIAASAAVPYAIGTLRFDLPEHGWWETDPATKKPTKQIVRPLPSVRLWDGGAYENMGLEPLFKPVGGLQGCDFLICSDASGPLVPPKRFPVLEMMKGRLSSPRLFDIASDQIRGLRSRMLMGAIGRGEVRGVLVRMGTSMRKFDLGDGERADYLNDQQSLVCLNYPTNLTRISQNDFDLISRHGAEISQVTLAVHA